MVIYVGLSHLVDGHHAHRLGVGGDRWVELDRALDPGAHLARASFGSARSCRRARRRVPSGAQMRQGASVHGRRRSRRPAATHVDLDPALEALDADALRRFIRAHAATLDDELRAVLADALLEHAARHGAGYGPKTPGAEAVREAEGFAAAARRLGYADPNAVDHHLRAATTAFLARDYAAARHIFEALLRPIAAADVDLGEQELVDEVLGVSVHDCAARWVASVYVTSPPADRADNVLEALNAVDAVAPMAEPLAAMERVVLDPLPGLADFLPGWSALLQREAASGPRWHERSRLREAVMRAEGTAGLARLARTSKCPEDARAWCTAVAAEGNWAAVLRVNDEAVALVESPPDRGDFHDAAALAARELGRPDFAARLETAWRVAPTLPRLLRWLLVDGPDPAAVAKRAETARAACPRGAGRLQGLLAVLAGDLEGAASLLARAPGLGWSRDDHPGHVLFPVLSWALGGEPPGSLREAIAAPLHRPAGTVLEVATTDGLEEPRLDTPAVVTVLRAAGVPGNVRPTIRSTVHDALCAAASARVHGVLRERRRRRYGHAALLVACCVELDTDRAVRWAADLRERTRRFPAFRAALDESLGGVKA